MSACYGKAMTVSLAQVASVRAGQPVMSTIPGENSIEPDSDPGLSVCRSASSDAENGGPSSPVERVLAESGAEGLQVDDQGQAVAAAEGEAVAVGAEAQREDL